MVKWVFGKIHQLIFRVIELFMNYFFILFFLCNELFTFPSPTQHLQTVERARHCHNCDATNHIKKGVRFLVLTHLLLLRRRL